MRAGWQIVEDVLVYTANAGNHSSAVAAFSLDGALVDVKCGNKAWRLKFKNVERKLKNLHEKKYKIAIFTDRIGLTKNAAAQKAFQRKIEHFLKHVNTPAQIFIATSHKKQKPIPTMWQLATERLNGNLTIEPDRCFYVGGSLVDRLFAANVEIKYYTSEEYFFQKEVPTFEMPAFDPRVRDVKSVFSFMVCGRQEVAVIVGRPCSGKTFFCTSYLLDYHYICIENDCRRLENLLVKTKRSIAIDSENATKEIRENYISVAKKYNIPCRCFLMNVSRQKARHINKVRELATNTNNKLDSLLDDYDKVYEPPDVSEGFKEIVLVPFVPRFSEEEQETLYHYFLLPYE